MMVNLKADRARQITERSSQSFNWKLLDFLDEIESDILRNASKGYNEVTTTKFVHKESFSILKVKYREAIQKAKKQLVEAGYGVDVKETDISKSGFWADDVIKISMKVSW